MMEMSPGEIEVRRYRECYGVVKAFLQVAKDSDTAAEVETFIGSARRTVISYFSSLDEDASEFFAPHFQRLTEIINLREKRLNKLITGGRIAQ